MKRTSFIRPPIQAILFDLDGTIIDSEASAAQSVLEVFQEWKIAIRSEDATFLTGRTWAKAFDYLFSRYSIPKSRAQAEREILDRYRKKTEEHLICVPGSVQAVEALAAHFPLALVSGSGRREILWALNRLGIEKHFRYILGAEDYTQSKPEPDGYLKACELLGVQARSCLVFEDSTAGIQSGRAAGAWVVAISSTNHFKQDHSQAHQVIPDFHAIDPEWIERLKKTESS
ncbi:MAG: HAD family hydrolase [Bdellovibrionia bacterium]